MMKGKEGRRQGVNSKQTNEVTDCKSANQGIKVLANRGINEGQYTIPTIRARKYPYVPSHTNLTRMKWMPFHVSRFMWSLILIGSMIVPKSVWAQSEAVVEIQYHLDDDVIDESPQLNQLGHKTTVTAGEAISRYYVRKSIEAIYAIGDFSQVEVVTTPAQGGVLLVFQLTSKIRVGKVEFTGTRLDKNLLREVMKSHPEKEYSGEIARKDRQRILNLYRDYGYFRATVDLPPPSDSVADSKVNLLYNINEGDRAHIREIRFEGIESLAPKELNKELKSKEGEVYQKQSIEDDMRRIRELYQKNGYLTVEVESRPNHDDEFGTVSLLYKISEGKKVTVKLFGDGIDKNELKKKLILFKQNSYSNMILDSTARRIFQTYQQKGYYQPKVSYQIEQESDREVIIRFDIDLGQVLLIRRISFEGNRAFDASTLLDQMKTQPRSRFAAVPGLSWLFSKGVYDPAAVDTDRRALELFYKKAGYPDTRITIDKEIDQENQLILHIKINEGEQQFVHRVLVEGNKIFKTEELYDKLVEQPGEAYSKDIEARDLRHLQLLYNQEGYIYAGIEPRYYPETDTLVYRISEGIQAKFGKFYFYGNHRVKLNVLRREFESFGLREGAVFNPDNLVQVQQRLLTLGLFRAIDIQTPGRFENQEVINVNVRVEVRKPGAISVSGGFSPSEGYRGTLGVTHSNIFKRNVRAGTKISIGTRGNLYEATLIEPWLKLPLIEHLVGPTIGTFRLFEDNLEEQDDTCARGGTVNLAKTLGLFSNLAIQYKYQELRQKRPELPEIHTSVSSVGFSVHRDSRDHFLNPKKGWLNEVAIEYSGGFLGGQTSFFKFTTDHRYYRPLGGNIVLASAIRLGFEEGLRSNRDRAIISFERFRAGGSTTVRGYEERSLGPLDEFGNHRGDVLFILNTELRVPIYKFIGGVVFFDTGNVWDKLSRIDDSPLHSAVGLGLRADTPLGPARFDFAAPLRKGSEPQIYWIQLGHAF